MKFIAGQRWTSVPEPELGIGKIEEIQGRNVKLFYPLTDETRLYRIENAPLKRFILDVGQNASSEESSSFEIVQREENNGTFIYFGPNQEMLLEADLKSDLNAVHEELLSRLLERQTGRLGEFTLREKARKFREWHQSSAAFGFSGPRIQAIPHQIAVAMKACSQNKLPRLLLSDEVGLGKTIEAGLIYHKLKQTRRIHRTLILVPSSLKYQWMVELYRRFNALFSLIETVEDGFHTLEESSEIICDTELLKKNPKFTQELIRKNWDLLILDEAHHLRKKSSAPSIWTSVETLAKKTKGILLLTATPIQVDPHEHFARLQLLDPLRYNDYTTWHQASEEYRKISMESALFLESKGTKGKLPKVLANSEKIQALLESSNSQEEVHEIANLFSDLLGPGKAISRNTRSAIGGFPSRILLADILPKSNMPAPAVEANRQAIVNALSGIQSSNSKLIDPRIPWLIQLLKKHTADKFLCICSNTESVQALNNALKSQIQIDTVVFHEEIPLVARDRAAAWFNEKDGARLLISSEIGSEGRNFQSASRLILFDLPLEPSLLEQRIGRLDRIGQREEVKIHVPLIQNTIQANLFRWFHEGLDAFLTPLLGANTLFHEFDEDLFAALVGEENLNDLIEETRESARFLRDKVEKRRDRLLELASSGGTLAQPVITALEKEEQDPFLEEFFIEALDYFAIESETGPWERSFVIRPSDHMLEDSFPGLPPDGMTMTRSRKQALDREDLQLLAPDHPLVQGVCDAILGKNSGQISCFYWPDSPEESLIRFSFLVEIPAPSHLGLSEIYPPQLLSLVYDPDGNLVEAPEPHELEELTPGKMILDEWNLAEMESILKTAHEFVQHSIEQPLQDYLDQLTKSARIESARLQMMKSSAPQKVEKQLNQIRSILTSRKKALKNPSIQLDSICLIQSLRDTITR